MSVWTLLYDGVEKTLADWGIAEDWSRTQTNQARGTVTFNTTEDFDAGATQFEYGMPAIIYRDRTGVGSGGTIYFQGYFDSPKRTINGSDQNVQYELHNVWWLFESHPFQQRRNIIDHYDGTTPVLAEVLSAEVYLGEKSDLFTRQTNGEQMQEIIDWMNECFNATKRGATGGRDDSQDIVQGGTIEPRVYLPITRVGTILCAEAAENIFRLQPDTLIWIDDSTVPPSLNVRTLGKWDYGDSPPTFIDYTNLPEIVLTITAEQERQLLVQRQDLRTIPGVVIYYWGIDNIDGRQVPHQWIDKAPVDLNLYTPKISIHFVELQGGSAQYETADIVTRPIADAVSGDDAAKLDFWKTLDSTLLNPRIDPDSILIGDAEVVDANGDPVDTETYPNALKDTSLPHWAGALGYGSVRATVRAAQHYDQHSNDTFTNLSAKAAGKLVNKTIRLTDAETGTLKILSSAESPELPPLGVADAVYRSANATMHAGVITFVGDQVRSDIGIGCRLTLVGPNTTFENCVPQTITERPCSGEMEVRFGPMPPANVNFLQTLMKATRVRTLYRMDFNRATGEGGGGDIDNGTESANDDTAHSAGGFSRFGVEHDL